MGWIAKNGYLTKAQMENNVRELWDFFRQHGCTLNAVSAMAGNMQTESGINPGIWESLRPFWRGYGLVQWSPYTKYSEWAGENWEGNGDKQCERILYEAENGLQWFANPEATPVNPPITLAEFLVSDLPPATLANYFLWYYEHPANPHQSNRAIQAEYWYVFLSGEAPPAPDFSTTKLPIWFYIKQF